MQGDRLYLRVKYRQTYIEAVFKGNSDGFRSLFKYTLTACYTLF